VITNTHDSALPGAAGADDDRGGCVLASSRPFDARPLAQLGFGSARDVVIFLVAAISANDVIEWLRRAVA
jgi:hypothetical protein